MCCFQKELPYGSYHHLELCNLISNHKIKPNITGIPETRLQRGKQLSSKQCLWTCPNWIMKRMNTFIYWQKHKIQAAIWPKYPWKKVESTFIKILNKKQKNIIGWLDVSISTQTWSQLLHEQLFYTIIRQII